MPKSYKRDVSSKSGMLSHFSFSLAPFLWLTFAIFFCSSFIFTYLYKIYINSGEAYTSGFLGLSPSVLTLFLLIRKTCSSSSSQSKTINPHLCAAMAGG